MYSRTRRTSPFSLKYPPVYLRERVMEKRSKYGGATSTGQRLRNFPNSAVR